MDDPQLLPHKLKSARERRGWTVYQAAQQMPGVYLSTLRTIEGSNPQRAPAAGGEMKLKTAVAIAAAYFPDVSLRDLMGGAHRCLLRFMPRDSKSRKILKSYQPPPLPPTVKVDDVTAA
jgi:hypothetical protein